VNREPCGSGRARECVGTFNIAFAGMPAPQGQLKTSERGVRYELTTDEAPGDKADGQGRQGHPHGQRFQQTGRVFIVLDQKHQATEQAGNRGQQHQDNRGLEHGDTPGGCGDVDKYSDRPGEAPMRPFRPGWVPTLVVLALLPGLIALGCWQLGRAEEKRVLLAAYAERRVETPVATAQLTANQDNAFRRVHLYGRFDAEHSLLLDNRMRDGLAGVELLQPFHDQASGVWLLVNRGWLPWPDRRTPVQFDTPAQALALDASVYVAPGSTFQLHPDPAGGQWPHLLTAVDATQLWQQLDREGFAHELRLEPGPATYRLDWPVVAMGPEKHLGYAVQWFALATTLVLLYLYFGWHHNKEKRHGHRHSTGSA